MTNANPSDPLLRQLEHVSGLEPDRARASHVRARCHARLALRRSREERLRRMRNAAFVSLERALVAGLCLIYLSAVAHEALSVHGLL